MQYRPANTAMQPACVYEACKKGGYSIALGSKRLANVRETGVSLRYGKTLRRCPTKKEDMASNAMTSMGPKQLRSPGQLVSFA